MARAARKDVHLKVSTAGAMVKGEMIAGEFSDPAGLATIAHSGFTEILQILVISPDFKRDCGSHEKVAPLSEGMAQRQQEAGGHHAMPVMPP